MEILNLLSSGEEQVIEQCEKALREGKIVVAPTDTVYGILGRADQADVIRRVFALKKRPQEKVLPIFVKNIAEARRLAYISDAKAEFLKKIWPGPVTVIFQHKEKLPAALTPGKDTLGIRIPNSLFLLRLLERLEFPLLQTSANISASPAAKKVSEVQNYFEKSELQPDLIVDGGEIIGKQSTIVDFTGKNPIVLRTGTVTREELGRILEELKP